MFLKKQIIVSIIVLCVASSLLIGYLLFYPKTLQGSQGLSIAASDKFSIQVRGVPLPKSLDFAGESVPLELYYVKEHLEWELTVNTYWHSSTLLNLKRSSRWFPVIEPILKQNNIPDDFKYLSLIESGFQNVTSPVGAIGFWQFLKGTAIEYGLEVNQEVDERYHVEKSTVAACKYFTKAYEKYKSWTLVAAAYNAGSKGIDRQIEIQKETNYYNLLLADETERYVFRILALKTIINQPLEYGFELLPEDYYQPLPYKIEMVSTAIVSWADYAKERQLSYRLLKEFNPWLRQPDLKNPSLKTYELKIPDIKAVSILN